MRYEWEHFFLSKQASVIFILTHTDGKTRNDLLGIKRIHFVSDRAVEKWYREISDIIDISNCEHPLGEEALTNLTKMYNVLTMR